MANKPKEDANGASLATMPSADAARIIPHVSLSNLSDTQANERVKQQIARHREKEPGQAANQPDTIHSEEGEEIRLLRSEFEALMEKCEDLENGGAYEDYDAALDEQGDVKIGGLTYAPSHVLKNVDEIAYNCGYSEYIASAIDENHERMAEIKTEIKEALEIAEDAKKEASA